MNFGDYGLCFRHDRNLDSVFYYVDGGGSKFALGECSHKVAKNLGVTRVVGTPCTWDNNFPVSFMVFPRSGDMHFDPAKGVEIGFGIMERHENRIRNALRPRMAELSRAENAKDLALLMAFNEGPPTTAPNGKLRLDAYLKKRGATPPHFVDILASLSHFGFWPFAEDPKDARDPFTTPHLPPRPQTF